MASERSRIRTLRGDLDAIVLTALRREPGQRYPGAGALADDIDSYLADEPVRARPDSRLYRWRKFLARHALPVSAALATVAALAIGLGVALWQAERATALLDGAPGEPRIMVADDWADGMGASLRAGMRSLADSTEDAVMLSLVDLPDLVPEVVARVGRAARSLRCGAPRKRDRTCASRSP